MVVVVGRCWISQCCRATGIAFVVFLSYRWQPQRDDVCRCVADVILFAVSSESWFNLVMITREPEFYPPPINWFGRFGRQI